ncbi:MAG TPA: DUF1553 domain-containing protein, partial [Planctomycetaceae bacterium]|nr:DUF1553 domain-containing protein [Planctomycetaceae bacterium]
LLKDPTDAQLIATGFNRNHVTTNEGGSIKEEVYVRNVVDRVVTFGTVFMGMTFDCSRCHDHKYDPFTMDDFYSLFAYFNSLDGTAMDKNIKDPPPILRKVLPEQQEELDRSRTELASWKQKLKDRVARFDYAEPKSDEALQPQETVWVEDALPEGAKPSGPWQFVTAPSPVFSGEKASTQTAKGRDQHFFTEAKPLTIKEGDRLVAYVFLDPDDPPKEIMLQWNDGSWEHRAFWGEDRIDWGKKGTASRRRIGDLPKLGEWVRLEVPASDVGLKRGAKVNGWAFTQFDGTVFWDKAGVVGKHGYTSLAKWLEDQRAKPEKGLPKEVAKAIRVEPAKRTAAQDKLLREYFIEHVYVVARKEFKTIHDQIQKLQSRIESIQKKAPTTLIFREKKKPRQAYYLHRGEYDQKRHKVSRRPPKSLPPLPEGAPNNRLGLARWLVSPDHPLTSRVAVNRFWAQVFGTGIVKTAEDFGVQGERPSHPKLLDWLAVDFRESGWDVKHLMKQL